MTSLIQCLPFSMNHITLTGSWLELLHRAVQTGCFLKGQRRPLCLGPEGSLHLEGPTVPLCGNCALTSPNQTLLKGSHLSFLSTQTKTSIILSDSCGKAPLHSEDFREWQAAQRCAGSTHQDPQDKNNPTCVEDQGNLSTQHLSTVPATHTF